MINDAYDDIYMATRGDVDETLAAIDAMSTRVFSTIDDVVHGKVAGEVHRAILRSCSAAVDGRSHD